MIILHRYFHLIHGGGSLLEETPLTWSRWLHLSRSSLIVWAHVYWYRLAVYSVYADTHRRVTSWLSAGAAILWVKLIVSNRWLLSHSGSLHDRSRELRDRSKELRDRSRELRDKSRELQDRSKELGDRSKELHVRSKESHDRSNESHDLSLFSERVWTYNYSLARLVLNVATNDIYDNICYSWNIII